MADVTRVLIAAGGAQERWNNYLGVPKWMASVEGEPIAQRTVRQLRERGLGDIIIIGTHPQLRDLGVPVHRPINTWNTDINKVSSGKRFWADDTIVAFGDVWFSDDAMDLLVRARSESHLLMLSRPYTSAITGGAREVFSLRFPRRLHQLVLRGCAQASCRNQHRAWWLQQYLATQIVKIDDWTDDFDNPEGYERWTSRRQHRREC